MQGKEASEQETGHFSAGIDVGKSWLDGHITPGEHSLRVSNTRSGISKLKRWLDGHITPDWLRLRLRANGTARYVAACMPAGLPWQ